MKKRSCLFLPMLLANPFQTYRINLFNHFEEVDVLTKSIDDLDFNLNNGHDLPLLIMINNNEQQDPCDETYLHEEIEKDIQLTSDLRQSLFPKDGTTYSEKTKSTRRGSSKKTSSLTFRQTQNSNRGQASSSKGLSSPTHPENMANFEKAGIPINPKKNPNKKPDNIQTWRWDKKKHEWIIVGDMKVQLSNGKIITEKEWQRILMHKSRKS